ncbi:thyroglobulin-like [Argopecten irradians]|uniref:thyroglobulin-like n=1 Tax=Argopecten irradians TaxID=31199 RepID=UPI00371E21C9
MTTAMIAFFVLVTITMGAARKTPCFDEEDAIDAYLEVIAGQNGGMPPMGYDKPDCDPDGSYSPLQCVGASCHCKSADGIQISGEFEIALIDKSSCRCKRDEHEFMMTQMVGQSFDCTATGGYTPVQCTGSVCFCVDFKGDRTGPGSINIAFVDQLMCDDFK